MSVQPVLARSGDWQLFGHSFRHSGAVLAGATVTVTAQATNASRNALTDDTGHFLIPLLGVGDYAIKVDAKGFKPSEVKTSACRSTNTANSTSNSCPHR